MKRTYLNIHLEGMDDNGEKLKRILDENIPCAISIAPETLRKGGIYSEQYPYLPGFVDLIGEVVNKPGNILGQQGNIHKCKHKHTIVDPYHENSCLYNKSLSIDEQREIMQKGNETLLQLLGKKAEMYLAPNHQGDFTTLDAACEERYPLFSIRGLKVLTPLLYKGYDFHAQNLLVVPEVKLGQQGNFFYVHYDEIEKNRQAFEKVVKNANSFYCIGVDFSMHDKYFRGYKLIDTHQLNTDLDIIKKNMRATNKRKFLRDIKNLPRRILKNIKN